MHKVTLEVSADDRVREWFPVISVCYYVVCHDDDHDHVALLVTHGESPCPLSSPPPDSTPLPQVKNENQLRKVSQLLDEQSLSHYQWIEQPENIFTALATAPYRKSEVGEVFRKNCQLLR